jgi:hypothetical protein
MHSEKSDTLPSKELSVNKENQESSTTTTTTHSAVDQPKRDPVEEEIISALRSKHF